MGGLNRGTLQFTMNLRFDQIPNFRLLIGLIVSTCKNASCLSANPNFQIWRGENKQTTQEWLATPVPL